MLIGSQASFPRLASRQHFSQPRASRGGLSCDQAYDLVARGFGPGFNGPLLLAVQLNHASGATVVPKLATAIGADPGVDRVVGPFPSNGENPAASDAFIIRIIPKSSPQDQATTDTVSPLRNNVVAPIVAGTGAEADLAGLVATNVDFTGYLAKRS